MEKRMRTEERQRCDKNTVETRELPSLAPLEGERVGVRGQSWKPTEKTAPRLLHEDLPALPCGAARHEERERRRERERPVFLRDFVVLSPDSEHQRRLKAIPKFSWLPRRLLAGPAPRTVLAEGGVHARFERRVHQDQRAPLDIASSSPPAPRHSPR